jgi:beta-barrel assembly-enhancing protease
MLFRAKTLRRAAAWTLAALLAVPAAFGQTSASQLPDLGDATASDLPLQTERRLGEEVMRDIRRDPAYLDDPEITEYVNALGGQLAAAAPGHRDFEFFVLRDATVNAFALPGGFIGVHTGLISTTANESELASVLGHEMGHVIQRHIARQLGIQKQMQMPMMVAMAAAILLGRSRPDLAAGATMAVQGGAIQSQLSFSREYEREADRVGLQTMAAAGFDPNAMGAFFEKMERSTRLDDPGTVPAYFRTHPLTTERIAEAENRAAQMRYHQHADSIDYTLVRAKIRAEQGDPRDAVTTFASALRDQRYASEAGARYGLAVALMRAGEPKQAEAEAARLRAMNVASSMVDTLQARARVAQGDRAGALQVLKTAAARYPYRRSVLYAELDALQDLGRYDDVLSALAEPLRFYPRDAKLYEARARAYASLGKRFLQHQAQAEVYALRGSLPAAIEQLQFAQRAGDADFYQLSVVDARLKELRAQQERERKDQKQQP